MTFRQTRSFTAADSESSDGSLHAGAGVPAAVRELLDASPDAALLIASDGRVEYLNPRAVSELRGSAAWIGQVLWDVWPGARDSAFHRECRTAAEQGVSVRFETDAPPLTAWHEIHAAPLAGGRLGLWLRSIARRKAAERALVRVNERASLAARATQDTIYDLDFAAREIHWSEALSRCFGYPVTGDFTPYDWWLDRVHPDDRERVRAEVDGCLDSTADRFTADYRFRRADGTYADVHDRGFVVRDEAGRAARLVGAMQDNSIRDEAIRALRQREADLTVVCEHATIGILHRSASGQLLLVNRRFCEIIGRTEAELQDLSPDAYTHPDDREWNSPSHYARVASGESLQMEKRYLRPDGTEVWCEVHVSPVASTDGGPASFVIVAQDITERKAAADALRRSEERLRLIQEAAEMADFESGIGTVSICSDRFFEQAGLPIGDNRIAFEEFLRLVHPDDQVRINEEIQVALAEGDLFSSEFRIRRADTGEERWISCRTRMIRDEAGVHIRTIGAHRDITDRKRSEEALRESEERFRLAAEAAGLGIWDFDAATGRREWSQRLTEIWGLPEGTAAAFNVAVRCLHPDDRRAFSRQIGDAVHGRSADRPEGTYRITRMGDGAERWIAMRAWKTLRREGDPGRIIVTVRDVTDEKTAAERVLWSASHDPLTGLANRLLFQTRLEDAIREAGASGRSVGLLMLDVDNFKQINDSLGHDAGDTLLKLFAERLEATVRSTDTVARFGGDEFAIVVPDLVDGESLSRTAQSILERLRDPFIHAGKILDCRASIGASRFPIHGRTAEELLKNADMALYSVKSGGRGTSAVFLPQMREDAQRRVSMLELARKAIEEDRLVPYYQPKLDLVGGSLIGFEALLRWRDAAGVIHLPATLEAAFEDLDVAAAISDRIIDRAITDMRGWLERGVAFRHVAVNASAAEFRRNDFAERLLERLRLADIPTRHLQLEVTESVFLGRGAEYVHRALGLLSAAGVQIALDDFGTGYASLRHLKDFPVDIIKIDRSFVRDMEIDPGDEAIVRAVINLGRSLGIKVVAEGIEKQAQAQRLVELQCDYGQGFLFSRAVPAAEVPAIVEASGAPLRPAADRPGLARAG